jgi:uncharacterized protein
MIRYIILPIVGFFIGIFIISFGVGGGAAYVGILTVFFNVSPAIAVTTSLATIIPTTAMGAFSHWKSGNVNIRLGLEMLAGGIVGSIVGSLCSGLLPENLYSKVIGAILLLLCVQIVVTSFKKKHAKNKEIEEARESEQTIPESTDILNEELQVVEESEQTISKPNIISEKIQDANTVKQKILKILKPDVIKATGFGLIGGIMSGLVGLSGGTPITAGLMILGCGAFEVVGTSIFVLVGVSILSFLLHLGLGGVDWMLVGLLAIGTVSGAFVGPVLLKHTNKDKFEKVMQPVLIIMIGAIGVLQLFK